MGLDHGTYNSSSEYGAHTEWLRYFELFKAFVHINMKEWPDFVQTCATCSELPSNISTMALTREKRSTLHFIESRSETWSEIPSASFGSIFGELSILAYICILLKVHWHVSSKKFSYKSSCTLNIQSKGQGTWFLRTFSFKPIYDGLFLTIFLIYGGGV